MTDTANPDPKFETRAELEAWIVAQSQVYVALSDLAAHFANIRRVTLAHMHLGEG